MSGHIRVTAKVTGDKELLRKLQSLSRRMQSETLASAVMDGAYVVERRAKLTVPVDTGNLKNSIRSEVVEQRRDFARAETGTDVEYAAAVEFGTETMAAQPYLRPALDENHAAIERAIRSALKRALADAI